MVVLPKTKKKKLQIQDPVFKIAITVYNRAYKINEVIKSQKNANTRLAATRIDEKNGYIDIWLGPEAHIGVLVHELYHAIHWAVHSRGMSSHDGITGEEVMAYLLQYFTDKTYTLINDY